jgi:hypothetical protein
MEDFGQELRWVLNTKRGARRQHGVYQVRGATGLGELHSTPQHMEKRYFLEASAIPEEEQEKENFRFISSLEK